MDHCWALEFGTEDLLGAQVSLMWLSARALGVAAWLASSAAVLLGLAVATRLCQRMLRPQTTNLAHRTIAVVTVLLVAGHVALLIPDPYARLSLLDVFVPGLAARGAVPTALGTIAFLLLLSVVAGSLARSRLSHRAWRGIHVAAFAVWPLATAHYVLMGTDAMRAWSLAMMTVVVTMMVAVLVRRGFTPPRGAVVPAGRGASGPMMVTVARVIDETADARSLVLSVPSALRHRFDYRPGQYLTVRVPSEQAGSVARCYSLSSSPFLDVDLKVTVKRTPGGYASNWLCDQAHVGLELEVLAPAGVFTPATETRELVLVAGGSGITPIMSILKSALATDVVKVTLVYANRDEQSVIFGAELRSLASANPTRLVVHHWIESRLGRPTATAVTGFLAPRDDAELFICGPSPFMDLVNGVAVDAGWPVDRIRRERFRSLTTDPFSPRPEPRQTRAAATSMVEVELGGETHWVDWPQESSLVDAMLDAGLEAPYSCLEGACATCVCTLVKGSVDVGPGILDETERNNGAFLGCQARPSSAHVKVRF
jgi:3-ketosteroid 9alpha-monooxygenase subunit B